MQHKMRKAGLIKVESMLPGNSMQIKKISKTAMQHKMRKAGLIKAENICPVALREKRTFLSLY